MARKAPMGFGATIGSSAHCSERERLEARHRHQMRNYRSGGRGGDPIDVGKYFQQLGDIPRFSP